MKLKNTITSALRFLLYGVGRAVAHPRTPIVYRDIEGNPPRIRQESPIPWWGSVGVILIGVACWVIGAKLQVTGLDEAARAMVYVPLGSLFRTSLRREVVK